ncbi:MAG: DEAD/DEAH box helicase [Leptospiraceae bacterium]|nr:DEAD/DEAH box helicase [Leptospiraceae bacterium]
MEKNTNLKVQLIAAIPIWAIQKHDLRNKMTNINFTEMDLSENTLKALSDLKFSIPTPIQMKAIPILKSNRDLIGKANTGTGKTACYGIPLIEKLNQKLKVTQALIICPTRELVSQVVDELNSLAKYYRFEIVPIYGGSDYSKQLKDLKRNPEVIVGTPGRLLDHLDRRTIKTDSIHTIILDEADRMLDMGFKEDMEDIISRTPKTRQTVMFSATMSDKMIHLMKEFQKNPIVIEVESLKSEKQNIEQFYLAIHEKEKLNAFYQTIEFSDVTYGIIFCNTKVKVEELVTELKKLRINSAALHGDCTQSQREKVLRDFKEKKLSFLVATDVAGRGIDVVDLPFVLNYDFPDDIEDYVHRIGRTGRAGKKGQAISFINQKSLYKIRKLESLLSTKITPFQTPTQEDIRAKREISLKVLLLEKLNTRKKKIHPILDDEEIKEFESEDLINSLLELWMESKWGNRPEFVHKITLDKSGSSNREYKEERSPRSRSKFRPNDNKKSYSGNKFKSSKSRSR